MESFFDKYIDTVEKTDTIKYTGKVVNVVGNFLESLGPRCVVGEICTIDIPYKNKKIFAEVIGLREKIVKLMPYDSLEGIEVGLEVVATGRLLEVPVGENLLGRVIDSMGRPCDDKGDLYTSSFYPAIAQAPNALTRKSLNKRITTGVKAIDSFITVAQGQRLGIFAGSGVGKSTLMGMISRYTDADMNVIALIGERGREALDVLKKDLGPEGLKRSVVVLATGDLPQICKIRAAYVATAIAEYFRDLGKNVVLMMDSITRFAQAQRDVGTANGETPQRRGYPASVFNMIQQLLERAGTNDKGSITGFYTVLVDGGDFDEPISDTVRGILDGHIILDRKLVNKQHYPAIDVLSSVSRLVDSVNGPCTLKAMQRIRRWMAIYSEQEDMIVSGVYSKGESTEIDEAIDHHKEIEDFLCQEKYENFTMKESLDLLSQLSGIEIPEEEYTEGPFDSLFIKKE